MFRRPPWRRLLRVWPRERDYYSAQLRLLSKTLAWLRRLAAEAECDMGNVQYLAYLFNISLYIVISHYIVLLPPGSGRMEKRRKTTIAKIVYIMASLSCASILCAVVLLITNGSIRHAVFVADFRGGFPWRIFVADFQWRILRRISVADFRGGFSVADFRDGFAWRILRSGFP